MLDLVSVRTLFKLVMYSGKPVSPASNKILLKMQSYKNISTDSVHVHLGQILSLILKQGQIKLYI